MNTDYEKQATDFLTACNATLTVEYRYTGPYLNFADDNTQRDVYRFIIATPREKYEHLYGDSLHNTQRRIFAHKGPFFSPRVSEAKRLGFYTSSTEIFRQELKDARKRVPSAYDILSCLEKNDPGTFDDFCESYGYDDLPLKEYPRVMGVYRHCVEQYRAITRMFTAEQMDKLREIN